MADQDADVLKQIEYWRDGSEEDIEAARVMINAGKLRHGMFFAHLSVEKMLKAHVSKRTEKMPPKIHNLERLAKLSGLKINQQRFDFLRRLDIYQLAGRYPDTARVPLDRKIVREDFQDAAEMVKWLRSQL